MRWEGVYPCSHRANQARRTLPTTATGISLLARGRPVGRVCLDVVPGRIPARAGELVMSLAERHGLEYPCWRGLALQPGSTSPPSTGSMS